MHPLFPIHETPTKKHLFFQNNFFSIAYSFVIGKSLSQSRPSFVPNPKKTFYEKLPPLTNFTGLKTTLLWESAHPNGVSYADGFRYLTNGFFCWMLLGGLKRRKFN